MGFSEHCPYQSKQGDFEGDRGHIKMANGAIAKARGKAETVLASMRRAREHLLEVFRFEGGAYNIKGILGTRKRHLIHQKTRFIPMKFTRSF